MEKNFLKKIEQGDFISKELFLRAIGILASIGVVAPFATSCAEYESEEVPDVTVIAVDPETEAAIQAQVNQPTRPTTEPLPELTATLEVLSENQLKYLFGSFLFQEMAGYFTADIFPTDYLQYFTEGSESSWSYDTEQRLYPDRLSNPIDLGGDTTYLEPNEVFDVKFLEGFAISIIHRGFNDFDFEPEFKAILIERFSPHLQFSLSVRPRNGRNDGDLFFNVKFSTEYQRQFEQDNFISMGTDEISFQVGRVYIDQDSYLPLLDTSEYVVTAARSHAINRINEILNSDYGY